MNEQDLEIKCTDLAHVFNALTRYRYCLETLNCECLKVGGVTNERKHLIKMYEDFFTKTLDVARQYDVPTMVFEEWWQKYKAPQER